MSTSPHTRVQEGVGGSNPLSPTNSVLDSKLAAYLQELELLRKPNTLREARRICSAATPYIDPADPRPGVMQYLASRKGAGIEARTLENERIRIGAFLKHAGFGKLNIPKFRFVQRKPEVYTAEEVRLLLSHATGRDHWLFKTALQAGLRLQELMTLEYTNLLDTGIVITPHSGWTPKDHEERLVRVPKSLIASLRLLQPVGSSPLVFPTQFGNPNWHMLRALKRCAKRSGIEPASAWMHKFRACFCTTLLRSGMAIQDVMNQMGHSNVKSTMRYMALLEGQDMQQKVEAIWS